MACEGVVSLRLCKDLKATCAVHTKAKNWDTVNEQDPEMSIIVNFNSNYKMHACRQTKKNKLPMLKNGLKDQGGGVLEKVTY